MEEKKVDTPKKWQDEIINPERLKKTLDVSRNYLSILTRILSKKIREKGVIVWIAIISFTALWFSIIQLKNQSDALNRETENLGNLDNYNIEIIKNSRNTETIASNATKINDLIKANDDIKDEIVRYDGYKKELQSSYTNFFQYILVPKLNIRKEEYTNKINIDLVGENFLEKNPYNDINLYQKRSNFFSSTEKNQINTIDRLNIGEITETDFGLYSITIKFWFITPSKNALLFLADKISMTSDKENIALLWEFVYYLRQQVKTDKKTEIIKLKEDPKNKEIVNEEDKLIGRNLYARIKWETQETLVDDEVINKTVKAIMGCGSESDAICFYNFREKYRNIAELAYTIWGINNKNKTNDLKLFFQSMPPLMTVNNFNYEKKTSDQALNKWEIYEGTLEVEIYGQNISSEEINEIGRTLWAKCFNEEKILTPELAVDSVNKALRWQENRSDDISLTNINTEGKNKTSDLKSILESIVTEYPTINNYKKTIRLFEIYRMLNEGWFCTAI